MASPNLEKRVEQLEAKVVEIETTLLSGKRGPKNWRRAVEKYAGDQDLLHVFAAARKLREADRKSARTTRTKSRKPD